MDGTALDTNSMIDPDRSLRDPNAPAEQSLVREDEPQASDDPPADDPATAPSVENAAAGTASPEIESPDDGGVAEPAASSFSKADEPIEIHPHRVVEAILFASDSPMPPAKIAQVLGVGNAREVRKHVAELNRQYAEWGLSFRVEEIAGGYQMLTLPAYNTWLAKLLRARQETRLSQAAMETLAIVAYKQPCTRADIEVVRGVAAGDMLNRLREMNLVKIIGRAEDLGRPLLYGTTKRFLEVFGLPSLEDLPQVEALASGAKAAAAVPRASSEETVPEPAAAASPPSTEDADSPAEADPAEEVLAESIAPAAEAPALRIAPPDENGDPPT